MSAARYALIRLALETIAVVGLDAAFAPLTRGRGAILTFHRVTPKADALLPENAGLSITPDFLDAVLRLLADLDYEIIPLDAVPGQLAIEGKARPFVALTFDDGYRDNAEFAAPILRRHAAPYTLFVCAGFAERTAPLWWLDIEEAVMRLDRVALDLPDGGFSTQSETKNEKLAAARALYWRLRALDEPALQAAVATLSTRAGIDQRARIAALCMDWEELRAFAAEPLCTIGAHTLSHPRLAKLNEDDARLEMGGSRERILAELGIDARHFAYPVGDPRSAGLREMRLAGELGFASAATTVPDVLRPAHAGNLHALPRISVNGLYQDPRHIRALISGVPFVLKR